MTVRHTIRKFGKSLLQEGMSAIKTLEEARVADIKEKVEIAIHHAIKRIAIIVLFLAGALFILVGLGRYLSETVPGFEHGIGYAFIGACLILVGFIGKLFASNT